MLLGRHHEDAAVWLLDGHVDQIRWRILRITVAHQPQHRVSVRTAAASSADDAPEEVLAHGGALPGQSQLSRQRVASSAMSGHVGTVESGPGLGQRRFRQP